MLVHKLLIYYSVLGDTVEYSILLISYVQYAYICHVCWSIMKCLKLIDINWNFKHVMLSPQQIKECSYCWKL